MTKRKLIKLPLIILTIVILLIAVWAVFFSDRNNKKETDVILHYVSADGFSFYEIPYSFTCGDDVVERAEEILEQLKSVPQDEKCQPSIPQDIQWSSVSLDDTNLIIDFNPSYSSLTGTKEIFLRAGIVKTVLQLDEIDTVEFKINGTPLLLNADQPVGPMNADLFIDEVDSKWGVNQQQTVTLFYASKSGNSLVAVESQITVQTNDVSMEQLIIESLLGTVSETENYISPLPQDTKVLKTVTKDEICYVDLSKEFLNPMETVSAEVSVYAIVNSLIERDNISKVQFTVEGKTVPLLRETINLTQVFDRNLDLIQKK